MTIKSEQFRLTVLMIAECYAHVFLPTRSKSLCSNGKLLRLCGVIAVFALVLPLAYPLNRVISLKVGG